MPPKVLNKDSCRGCGSNIHKTACCPNRPCPCCFKYHSRGILDCPITLHAIAKVKAEKKRKEAAAKRSAAKAAAVVARQQSQASKLQKIAEKTAKYNELLPLGVVVKNKAYYTASNWDLTADRTCLTCGWLPKGCFCT